MATAQFKLHMTVSWAGINLIVVYIHYRVDYFRNSVNIYIHINRY